ncbi:hypothetical protein ACAF76_018985 [Brevibacillus sp. TJ4]|uniref:hypothetical protein n=1 Tax=Brevibacillus sp. TJ4 TaxID=3234853 RepID=UPI003BA2DCC1
MLSKAKMGILFGSMATVLSLGVFASAYAAEDVKTAVNPAEVLEKRVMEKGKPVPGREFASRIVFKENTELLTLLGLQAEELRTELVAGKTLAEIAESQGVEKQELVDLLTTAEAERLAAAVEAGKLTQEQADGMKAKLAERAEQQVNNPGFGGREGMGGKGFGGFFHSEELLTLLGLQAEELRTELAAGKTLAEIAESQGVEKQDVIDLLTTAEAERLAAAVEAGKLTQEQADGMKAKLAERVEQQVNNPGFGGREGMGGKGFGGFFHSEELLTLLGLQAEELRTELAAGKTLAEIAEAKGVVKQDVIDLLVAPQTEKLAAAVEAGKLTQEQADERQARLEESVSKKVEGEWEQPKFAESAAE